MQPTNPNQFTEKAWEAIVRTPEIAKEAQQQQIESEHLLQALLEQDGLAASIFNKAGANVQQLRDRTTEYIRKQARLSEPSSSVYLGRSLDTLLDRADSYRKSFEDDYISIEHLILAYAKDDRLGQALLKESGLDEAKLRTVIQQIRGSQKVTDQNQKANTNRSKSTVAT
jgi:ATP-dependent Clp protease ATP-binding subunit ClpB